MTQLDVIDLYQILTVSSMWQIFFQPWAKVGAALVWKLWENRNKIFFSKPKKTKIIEYDGS